MKHYNNFTIKTELKSTPKPFNKASSSRSSNIPPINYPEFKTTDSRTDYQRVSAYLLSMLKPLRNGMEWNGAESPERQAKKAFCFWSSMKWNAAGCELNYLVYQCFFRHMSCLYGYSALAEYSKQLMPSPSRQQKTTPCFFGDVLC